MQKPRIELPQALLAQREAIARRRENLASTVEPQNFLFFDPSSGKVDIEVVDGQAEILLYGEIHPYWGIDAWQFAKDLKKADAERIVLHIDSPGGYIADGILIYNALVDHQADVEVVVDSEALSAASFIAMAGDTIKMNRGAEMMIHSALVGVYGNAAYLREIADHLDRSTDKIAAIYEARAGQTVDYWLEAMAAETWYDADEAVEVGLADEAVPLKSKPSTGGDDPEPKNKWDLTGFQYQGRADAPDPLAPKPAPAPNAPEASTPAATAAGDEARQRARARAAAALAQ